MKPFDLEKAIKGEKVITRSGKPVRIICWDYQKELYPIVALVAIGEKTEELITYTIKGEQYAKEELVAGKSSLDLFMAPIKKEGWINVYKAGDGSYIGGTVKDSKEEALNASKNAEKFYEPIYLDTAKIEWEE